jgi:hypothetical protein
MISGLLLPSRLYGRATGCAQDPDHLHGAVGALGHARRFAGQNRSCGGFGIRGVTSKARLWPEWKEGQAGPRRRPQPSSRILTAWEGNSRTLGCRMLHSPDHKEGLRAHRHLVERYMLHHT